MVLETLFGKPRVLLGMVHLEALPGSPGFGGSMETVVRRAVEDARALESGGLDGAVVENFGDTPFYPEHVPAEALAAMALAIAEVRRAVRFPIGVNVLRNDARAALGLAAACGAAFLRVNVHIGASVTDQGLVQGRAHETLRERERLWARCGAPAPLLLADVDVKHASPVGERSLARLAEDTYRRGRADVLLVTGSGTGQEASFDHVRAVREAVPEAPVLVASGVSDRTVARALREANGALVGSWLERDGRSGAAVDPERVRALVAAAHG